VIIQQSTSRARGPQGKKKKAKSNMVILSGLGGGDKKRGLSTMRKTRVEEMKGQKRMTEEQEKN